MVNVQVKALLNDCGLYFQVIQNKIKLMLALSEKCTVHIGTQLSVGTKFAVDFLAANSGTT